MQPSSFKIQQYFDIIFTVKKTHTIAIGSTSL
jgi:hypothetical protein